MDFQFPLLGFLLCILCSRRTWKFSSVLSIPFIGIFALHRIFLHPDSPSVLVAFNSLYWDFCFASRSLGFCNLVVRNLSIPFIGIFALHLGVMRETALWRLSIFQFPLLGFLLCIVLMLAEEAETGELPFNSLYWDFCFASIAFCLVAAVWCLTFNSLYWDFCFASCPRDNGPLWRNWLSIPFIGIFALHQTETFKASVSRYYSFNSLYWDFCFASCVLGLNGCKDGCNFQFPLLGFLLCIRFWMAKLGWAAASFQFPLLGFLLCIYKFYVLYVCSEQTLSIPFIGIFALHPTWSNAG